MKRNIVVLGSEGMLGQMVKKYFTEKGHELTCFDERFNYAGRSAFTNFLKSLRNDVLINCIGKIRQKSTDLDELEEVNAIFPLELRNSLHEEVVLVHPSTDCVFNGESGAPYPTDYEANANDEYGWTKRLGEVALTGRPNTLIPRVSIIGPDQNAKGRGLLAWVMSNKPGSEIQGFTNHLWNGITTLEWCKQVALFIDLRSSFAFQLIQLGTREHYSKYDMLLMFNRVYELQLKIIPKAPDPAVDRRLVPDIVCKPLPEQLEELSAY